MVGTLSNYVTYWGMETMYIGMDLHKSTSSFCVMTKEGVVLREERIPTSTDRVTRFIRSLGKRTNLSLVLEPVSQWYLFADHLEELGVDVHLAHPRKLKAIASASAKTDALDARVLADHLRTNHLPEAYRSPKAVREWKELVRLRSTMVSRRTQSKNRLHATLAKHGMSAPHGLFTKGGRVWLQAQSFSKSFQLTVETELAHITYLDRVIKELTDTLATLVEETSDMKLLTTIPGIGTVLAATIMAEIGEIDRFPSHKQLQAYAGLVPWVRNSGGKEWHGHLTKQGSVWLRYAAVEAAVRIGSMRAESDLKDYYHTVRLNKNAKTATVATARKVLAVIWSVLKNQREFSARYPVI